MNLILRILFFSLVLFGLFSAGKLSLEQFQTGKACPILGDVVPACYVALLGFILIAIGATKRLRKGLQLRESDSVSFRGSMFWLGVGVAGGLAAFATVLELWKGGVCPVAFNFVPMCYLSLAFTATIAILFRYLSPADSRHLNG